MKYCHLNGQILELENASLGLTDLAILRAYAIFDYFRFEEGVPMFIDSHLSRFENSARKMFLNVPYTVSEINQFVRALITSNGKKRGCIRLVLTGGYSDNGYTPGGNPNFFILQHPSTDYKESVFKYGVKLLTKNYRREAAQVKTINYITPLINRDEMDDKGAIDVLYHKDDLISETSRANFFIVDRNNRVVTPDDFVLSGINRKILIEIAKNDLQVIERSVYMDELMDAKEAFITSTTKRIMPVTQIGDQQIGEGKVGPIYKELYKRFLAYEANYIKQNK